MDRDTRFAAANAANWCAAKLRTGPVTLRFFASCDEEDADFVKDYEPRGIYKQGSDEIQIRADIGWRAAAFVSAHETRHHWQVLTWGPRIKSRDYSADDYADDPREHDANRFARKAMPYIIQHFRRIMRR